MKILSGNLQKKGILWKLWMWYNVLRHYTGPKHSGVAIGTIYYVQSTWYNVRKGRGKATRTQMLCWHKQMRSWGFDERSEPGKPSVSRVSACS